MPDFTAADVDLPRLLATLQEWVEIETPSCDAERVNALANRVEAQARMAGLTVERVPGRDGVGDIVKVSTSHFSPGDRSMLVLAHLDTVHPVGVLEWREHGDRIFGPGIYDMKSGALMALSALELLVRTDGKAAPPVKILFTPDEELGSPFSRRFIEAEAAQARAALVVEPARDGGKVVVARKGVAMFEIAVRGRSSHAGTNPLDGHSAIRAAAEIVLALEARNDTERGLTVTVGQIRGGTARNVIPALCTMTVDVRLPDTAAERELMDLMASLSLSNPDVTFEIRGGVNRPAYTQNERSQRLFEFARRCAGALEIELVGTSTGGGSDGNFTAALGVPTLDGLGADGAGAHSDDEHILVSSLAPRTALLANLYRWREFDEVLAAVRRFLENAYSAEASLPWALRFGFFGPNALEYEIDDEIAVFVDQIAIDLLLAEQFFDHIRGIDEKIANADDCDMQEARLDNPKFAVCPPLVVDRVQFAEEWADDVEPDPFLEVVRAQPKLFIYELVVERIVVVELQKQKDTPRQLFPSATIKAQCVAQHLQIFVDYTAGESGEQAVLVFEVVAY